MAIDFKYSKNNDFPNNNVSLTVLYNEVSSGSIGLSSKLDNIYSFGDTVSIIFSTDLAAAEETELNNIVSNHGTVEEEKNIIAGLDDTMLNILVDEDGYFTYVGESIPGTLKFQPKWRIFRISEPSSGPVEIIKTFANGTALFDKVWNDRTTYNYDTG